MSDLYAHADGSRECRPISTEEWWRRINEARAADPKHWSFAYPDLEWVPPEMREEARK